MAELGDFRAKLQQQLQDDLEIPFVTGLVEGPCEQDLGCCMLQRTKQVAGRAEELELYVTGRIFKQFEQVVEPTQPLDTTPFELLLGQLMASVRAHQADAPPAWMQQLIETNIDTTRQCLEYMILGYTANAAMV